MRKHIFVTGGVVSSLGKGVTTAAISLILERCGYSIAIQKIDPYLNIDAGTMNPYQHGEVYVTSDGAETDLDLGHYERFTNAKITHKSNITAGKIYSRIIEKERNGDYLGQTIQVIPHVTDEIKLSIKQLYEFQPDIVVTEIGGTVGDIESLPFLEAIRQFRLDLKKHDCIYIHLTLLPYLRTTGELKTKPTQQSVGKLREIGIIPDLLICRTERQINENIRKKISLFCNVEPEAVFEEKDVDFSIYELPTIFVRQGLHHIIQDKLNLPRREPQIDDWIKIYETVHSLKDNVSIAIVGKYLELVDSYKSIIEALNHCKIAFGKNITLKKINAEELEANDKDIQRYFQDVDGILIPGGFGIRGINGKLLAIKYARENKIPFLGLCLGMQCAAIEFARNVCNIKSADSQEFNPDTREPVICFIEGQKDIKTKGGTMRLGSYRCKITPGTLAAEIYQSSEILERHRHRLEFNNKYRELFAKKGMLCSGVNPEADLVEIIELRTHPFFIAVQFHPEFQSKPTNPHPLFKKFVEACYKYKQNILGTN